MDDHENRGYRRLFGSDELTVGLSTPLTGVRTETPDAEREVALARRAAGAGIDGLWVRDVPLYWPRFRDAGGSYDPWVLLTHLAANTEDVALGTASVVLPLRHPLHVATSAASVDRLSGGRLVVGIGSGDRPPEFAAFGVREDERGERFREAVALLRQCWSTPFPEAETRFGELDGTLDVTPKPTGEDIPLFVTGNARQSVEWIGEHADGWLFYWLPRETLDGYLADWHAATVDAGHGPKPFVMALTVDLAVDPTTPMEHVHGGFRAGSESLVEYLQSLSDRAVDHVVVSLRGDGEPAAVLDRFAAEVLDAR